MVEYQTQQVTTTQRTNPVPVEDDPPQVAYEKKKTVFRSYQVIWYILGFIEALLLFRFVLLMLGANPNSGFAQLIYGLSLPFAAPFQGLFPILNAGPVVFEWTTLVAMFVYFLVAMGITKLLQFFRPTSPEEVERVVTTA
jgi:uncharacterized protein YggT (Ycf19 family)